VATRPQRARYKIYIIDEVHMLSKSAFNALLKTLEEPPPHVKFILATTEVQKIPLTILSRCQRFDFGGINTARILNQLKQIATQEGVKADEDALRIVARRAGGSMRDAQSLLEQLLSFGGEKLTADTVHSILGTAADDRVVEIAGAVLAKDPTRALTLVARCADEGLQLGELLDQLIDYWRGLMLLNCSAGEVGELNVGEAHRDAARQQAQALTLDTILAGLDVLTTTKAKLRTTSHGQVLLEVAVVRMSRLDELVPVSQLALWLSQPGSAPATAARPAAAAGTVADGSKKNGLTPPADGFRLGMNGSHPAPAAAQTATPLIDASLTEILDKVKLAVGVMFAGELAKAGRPAIVGPKALVLRYPPRYNHAYEYCKDSARLQQVEGLLRQLTGQEWALRFELDASAPAPAAAAPPMSRREREKRVLEMPLLSRIVSHLDGRPLNIDVGFGEPAPQPEPEPEQQAQ
jgi:DNA polymerase-3 subunit gamma/tau